MLCERERADTGTMSHSFVVIGKNKIKADRLEQTLFVVVLCNGMIINRLRKFGSIKQDFGNENRQCREKMKYLSHN